MAAKDYRKGGLPFGFVPIPKEVLKSTEFGTLTASAKALMLDLAAQYTGKNNGRLCPSFDVMQRCGWTSKHTLLRAKRALLECDFALQTRIGHPPRTAEWIGFTWWKLDWHESMEVSPRGWPYLNFVAALSVVPKQHHESPKQAVGSAKTAPMKAAAEALSVQKQHHTTEVNGENGRGAKTAHVLDVAISGVDSCVPLRAVPDRRPDAISSAAGSFALLNQLRARMDATAGTTTAIESK